MALCSIPAWLRIEMETLINHKLIDLPRDGTLRLSHGQGSFVAVFEGKIWLTQHGDARDFIVEAGETVLLDRPGLVVAQGLNDSRIMVLDAEEVASEFADV